MSETASVDNPPKGKRPKQVNHIKSQVIHDFKLANYTDIVKEQVDKSASLIHR